jgi:hypothetical protein
MKMPFSVIAERHFRAFGPARGGPLTVLAGGSEHGTAGKQ